MAEWHAEDAESSSSNRGQSISDTSWQPTIPNVRRGAGAEGLRKIRACALSFARRW